MSGRTGGRWSRALSAVVGLVIAAPFYWLLIDTTSSPELIAGGVAAVIAAAAYSAAHHEPTANAAIRLRWLGLVAREIAKVPRGIVVVCAEVLKQTLAPRPRRGRLEIEPFQAVGDDPYELGRRGLAEAFGSLAPDAIVIGIDPDNRRLITHRVGPRQ